MQNAQHYCKKCGKLLNDTEFYISKNKEKFPPDGRLHTCKKCLTMHVDNWDPETFKWILEDVDVPYIKEEWDALLEKYGKDPMKITGLTIIGRYLSKMKLKQWSKYRWADTDTIAEKRLQEKIFQMKAQGLSGDQIEQELLRDTGPPKPDGIPTPVQAQYENHFGEIQTPVSTSIASPGVAGQTHDKFEDQLTEEDKLAMSLKWGKGYRAEEWIRMEQLYRDMMKSYDIQGAGHKDTLIMICKASLKANQLIDMNDIEGFQRMSRVYDSLMRSGKFTAAQNKEEDEDAIDSVGQLVAICEKDGFIPKYYQDKPQDKVDRTIQDMQNYTEDLVRNELGLGNLIENSLKAIEREKEAIKAAAEKGEEEQEREEEEKLFDYVGDPVTDQDFIDFKKSIEEEQEEDNK